MAVSEIIKRKIGRDLAEGIYLGVKAGVRWDVSDYRRLTADGNTVIAEMAIKRAIDRPHMARARVTEFIQVHGSAFLIECLNKAGDCTAAELNTALNNMETYVQELVVRRNTGETWDSIATDIETKIENDFVKSYFPVPSGYVSIWGD